MRSLRPPSRRGHGPGAYQLRPFLVWKERRRQQRASGGKTPPIELSLLGPNGETFGAGSPELTVTPHYLFVDVPKPAPGEWKLVATATGPAWQQATAVAFIDNPRPDFFVSVRPSALAGAGQVRIAANPVYVSGLGGEGVSIAGRIEGPAGFTMPISMSRNKTGAWSAAAGPFPHKGFYRVTLDLDVDATAALAPGEAIFAGPATPPVSLTPFRRSASAGFFVVQGEGPPCESGDPGDCDGDTVPDKAECPGFGPDIDKDGRPNQRDSDADGDEIPDAVERNRDLNRTGIPDMCERATQ